MFTGLIEEVGTIESVEDRGQGRRLLVRARAVLSDARVGDSLAIDGCCLTVVERDDDRFVVEAVPETLARTRIQRPGPRSSTASTVPISSISPVNI